MIDPKYREKWGRGKLQESWSGCSGIALVTDSTRKGDLMMILMIMVGDQNNQNDHNNRSELAMRARMWDEF